MGHVTQGPAQSGAHLPCLVSHSIYPKGPDAQMPRSGRQARDHFQIPHPPFSPRRFPLASLLPHSGILQSPPSGDTPVTFSLCPGHHAPPPRIPELLSSTLAKLMWHCTVIYSGRAMALEGPQDPGVHASPHLFHLEARKPTHTPCY